MSKPSNRSRPEPTKERQARAVESLQNGGESPISAMPAKAMAPPTAANGNAANGNGSSGGEGTPLAEELMTLKVKLPTLGANGELEALKTMRVKVPRQDGVDASAIGAAVAHSLQQLNPELPVEGQRHAQMPSQDVDMGRGRGGNTRLPRSRPAPADDHYEDDFVPEEALSLGRELSLRDIFYMVRERWMLGLSVGLLAAGALAFWMMSKPPVYESEAELLVELAEDKILPMESLDQEGAKSTLEQAMQVHAKRLYSAAYRTYVLETLELTTIAATPANPEPKVILRDYMSYPAFVKAYNDGLVNMFLRGKEAKPGQELPSSEEMFQAHYYGENGLSVSVSKRSQFITVAFRHPDKVVARQVTHAMVECYNAFLGGKEKLVHEGARVFLVSQTDAIELQIRKDEGEIIRFKQQHGIVENLEDGDNREGDKFNALDGKVAQAGFDLVELELQLKQVEAMGSKGPLSLSQLPVISAYGSVSDIKDRIETNRGERSQLDIKYLRKHPKIIANNTEKVALLDMLASNVALSVQDLRNRVEQKRQEESELQGAIADAETQALKDDDPMVEYKVMQSGLDILKGKYKMLLERLSETQISQALERTKVDVMTPALLPKNPIDQ